MATAGFFLFAGRPSPPAAVPPIPPGTAAGQGTSRLRAETVPHGATLLVDGKRVGVTPASLSLAPGKHELVLSLPGYENWEGLVEMEKGAEAPLSVPLIRSKKM